MLTIDKTQDMTIYDFMKNKGHYPFKKWRTTAKTENFSLIFSCSAGRFATVLLNSGFTEEDADSYIDANNARQQVNAYILSKKGKIDQKQAKFYVAADLMKKSFFDAYKGFDYRIQREQKFALDKGYIRTWHGPIRHLPELRYMTYNDKGELCGADKKLYSKLFSHQVNQACNTAIQSMESRIAFATWVNIASYIKAWNLKTTVFNNVHDSLDFWIYKPELELIQALIAACASWDRPPVEGIHMSMDCEVSDLEDLDHREETFYKHGVEIPSISIQEALKHYNAANNTSYVFIGADWWYDPYEPTRAATYTKYCKEFGKERVNTTIDALEGNRDSLKLLA